MIFERDGRPENRRAFSRGRGPRNSRGIGLTITDAKRILRGSGPSTEWPYDEPLPAPPDPDRDGGRAGEPDLPDDAPEDSPPEGPGRETT